MLGFWAWLGTGIMLIGLLASVAQIVQTLRDREFSTVYLSVLAVVVLLSGAAVVYLLQRRSAWSLPERIVLGTAGALLASTLALAMVWLVRGGDDVDEFDLDVLPGVQYDLDAGPGGLREPDLYRTVDGPDQISGVEVDGTFNPVQVVVDNAAPALCRRLVGQTGGRVRLVDVERGSKICLVTGARRPVLLTIREMPAGRDAPLHLRVTVLAP
jgi:hypothetical protein